jgi:PAS domain S-box-containing protein
MSHGIREAPLASHHDLFRLIVDSASDVAIFAMDADARVLTWNAAAERMLGYASAEAVGQPGHFVFTPEDRATGQPEKELETARREGHAPDERWHLRKDGTRFWAIGVLSALRDEHGVVIGFAKFMRDRTTQRAALESALGRARGAQEEAEEANRLKDEFLATLSHELRTPLNAIVGWAHLLRSAALDAPTAQKAVETIYRNAFAQSQLVSDLLDVSRIITGKLHVERRPLDLMSVIEATLETVRPAADAKEIVLRATLRPEAAFVVGDQARLQQVVWNLLSNAIKFAPRGGMVEIELVPAGMNVELLVRDSGPGIDPAFLPHVFERFRQADSSSTRPHRGLGLGLAIVRQLVEMHGGSVRAENRPHREGALFTVTLPRGGRPSDLESPDAPNAADAPIDATGRGLHGITVLVVDDETDSRDVAFAILTAAGARVVVAGDVDQALRILAAERPDVALIDLELPREDGYALLRRMRALPPGAGGEIPAATVTAYARASDRLRALEAGFERHVTKPVNPGELVSVVLDLARIRAAMLE